jgi:flagellar FliL protein
MKSKLKIIIPVLLIAAGGVYKFVLSKPAVGPPPKVDGQVYVLPKEFLVNLKDSRYAKVTVALVVTHDQLLAPAAGGHEAAAEPPEGFGTLEQEAVVRDLITDELTDADGEELISRKGRVELKEKLAKAINKDTDVKVEDVLFTDVAVQ